MAHTLTNLDAATLDTALTALRHWRTVGERWTDRHVPNLADAHAGRWFDADSMRAFGSRNLHLHRPGLLVETQTKAPGGTRWVVTLWVVRDVEPVAHHLGDFSSLSAARGFAERVDAVWPLLVVCHALRAAGCPGTAAELVEISDICGAAQ